jgi:hypothetical protein
MSMWEDYHFEDRILAILRDHAGRHHHMAPAFLTPYQIAIEFARRYPTDFQELGLPMGGEGSGVQNTLPQYIAERLSRRLRDSNRPPIEGGFLSSCYMEGPYFKIGDERICSSLPGSGFDLSLFRVLD